MYRWIVWNIVFPLHERLKGHRTYQFLREMEAADHLSPTELEELRRNKLRDLIDYCYSNVPYVKMQMRQAGLQPADIRDARDLIRLPLLTKADVRKHRESLHSVTAGELSTIATGGSTGEPLIFDISKRRTASRVAIRQRALRWWGVSVGDLDLVLWGSPLELTRQDWLRSLRDKALATQLLSAYELDEPTMSRYLDILEKRRFRQVFAYPSAIYRLCIHARKTGRELRRLGVKVVFVTSEVLLSYQRELIAQTFGCPVANLYGGRDSGCTANECPQGGMHVMADSMIVEIVDSQGRPVPPGETGQIVVTDLYSHEFPFIRYVTGDLGALSPRRCVCGRALPLLERIEGRSNDVVVTHDGRTMHGQSLVSLLMEIEGIDRFRICQKTLDHFRVEIVRNEHFREESEERIRKAWSERLRWPLQVTFEYPADLPQERSGKFRHIISEVAADSETVPMDR
jgi:phenylacetate-coenzyme A ligase PaaK-like adenylate-forming protein